MKQVCIKSCIVKKYRPTLTQKPIEERENVLNQDFTTTTINEKWVVDDIMYIYTLSFLVILKKEEVYLIKYERFETVRIALFQFIEGCYNRKQIHGSSGYLTPDE